MAITGPTPKPSALRNLSGDKGGGIEPKPSKVELYPPSYFAGEALAEWGRVVPELTRLGLVTKLDRAALIAYCEAWETYTSAMVAVREHGPLTSGREGSVVKNPAHQIARDAADHMMKWSARFGFTPSDRTRLSVAPQGDEDGPDAQILKILS